MANLTTTADLRTDVLDRGDELTDGGSEFHAKVLEYLNRQYLSICLGGCELAPEIREDWWWLKKYPAGVLTLVPPITGGTVTVTEGADSVTFTTAPASSVAGYTFKTMSDPTVYRVSAHTAGLPDATLDSVYVGASGTDLAYTLLKHDYAIAADVLRVTAPMRPSVATANDDPYTIYLMDHDQMDRLFAPGDMLTGVPEYFAVVHQATQETGNQTALTVRFNRGGRTEGLTRVEYDYLRRPPVLTATGSEEPLLPWEYRHILADAALSLLLVQKNDNRADAAGLSAKIGLQVMQRENRRHQALMSEQMGQIRPRVHQQRRRPGARVWRA